VGIRAGYLLRVLLPLSLIARPVTKWIDMSDERRETPHSGARARASIIVGVGRRPSGYGVATGRANAMLLKKLEIGGKCWFLRIVVGRQILKPEPCLLPTFG
jgi:hypothetical protein